MYFVFGREECISQDPWCWSRSETFVEDSNWEQTRMIPEKWRRGWKLETQTPSSLCENWTTSYVCQIFKSSNNTCVFVLLFLHPLCEMTHSIGGDGGRDRAGCLRSLLTTQEVGLQRCFRLNWAISLGVGGKGQKGITLSPLACATFLEGLF